MLELTRLLKADIMKFKSTQIIWIHFYIPILGLIVFLSYFSYSPWDSSDKISGYLQILCIAFPILIGIITSMVSEQEYIAGNFQNILGHSRIKIMPFLSKYILTLLLGLMGIIFSVIGFYLGFSFIDNNMYPFTMYLSVVGILISSNMFGYALHFFLSFRFSKSISIGVGILESFIAALFLTSIGDGVWPFYPSAWAIRFVSSLMIKYQNFNNYQDPVLYFGIIISIIGTILSLIIILTWFAKWEGKKLEE